MKKIDIEKWNNITKETINLIENLPPDSLLFKPDIVDSWSIHEHIIHLIDSEVNAFLRLKSILGQSGTQTFAIDENSWVQNINYEHESIRDYLVLFKIIRKIEGNLIERCALESLDYSNRFVIHNSYGKVDLDTWIEWYAEGHIKTHMDYMNRNLKLWKQAGTGGFTDSGTGNDN